MPDQIQKAPVFTFEKIANSNASANSYLAGGNFFDVVPYEGRYDAQALAIFNIEKNRHVNSPPQTGLSNINGQVRDIKVLGTWSKERIMIVARNNEKLIIFEAAIAHEKRSNIIADNFTRKFYLYFGNDCMNQLDNLNEEALTSLKEEIASGDERSFRRLFDLFSPKLRDFAFAMFRAKDGATEVVDQVFVKVWQQRQQIVHIHNLKVYLYAAVKNASLNYLSKKAREQVTEPFDYIDIEIRDLDSPEQQMISSEIFRKITQAVEELPPRCKMIFKLVREDGLKYKEVAQILNISINTVDAQMVIAVKKISERIQVEFDQFPFTSPFKQKTLKQS